MDFADIQFLLIIPMSAAQLAIPIGLGLLFWYRRAFLPAEVESETGKRAKLGFYIVLVGYLVQAILTLFLSTLISIRSLISYYGS